MDLFGKVGASVLVAAVAIGVGCGGEGDDATSWLVSGSLELGVVERYRFTAYPPDAALSVERGIQGGYHVFVGARLQTRHPPPEPFIVSLALVRTTDGVELASIRHRRELDLPDQDGFPTLPELIVFIPDPEEAYGQRARLTLELSTLGGERLDGVELELNLVSAE